MNKPAPQHREDSGPDRTESVLPVRPLDAINLIQCRYRLYLETWHRRERPEVPLDAGVEQRRNAAAEHRNAVADRFELPDDVRLRLEDPHDVRVEQTLAAMAQRAPRIWFASLPTSTDRLRASAELLIADPAGGYLPVIVVNHKVFDPRPGAAQDAEDGPLWTDVNAWRPTRDARRKLRSQPRDVIRLALVRRLLQECGQSSASQFGGVIGQDGEAVLVHDLSTSDVDLGERIADCSAIRAGTARPEPSRCGECRSCPWWSRCKIELSESGDVSLVANGSRAQALRDVGVTSVTQLARWRGPAPDQWQHGRFEDMVAAAQAHLLDVPLVRRVANVTVRRADVEVDVDLESYLESGAYLWGTWMTGGGSIGVADGYRAFATWDPVPTADEGRSFAEFWSWLIDVRQRAHQQGKTFAAYCYSRMAEDKWLLSSARRFVGMPGVPTEEAVLAFISSPQWVDIYQAVDEQFICPNGKGLKKIAPVAGFSWRDPDAGGEASMSWYRRAVGMEGEIDLAQRQRVLDYNEDDVRATKALREWMTDRANSEVLDEATLASR